ncbi:metallophosphoesterase family protein [Pseudoduganella sp. HUAS MS19]
MSRPLATLLHISDLHIGSIDPTTGDAAVSAAVQLGLDNFPLFDGLLGHHAKALRELAEFVNGMRDNDEKFQIIVTGDLSRQGDAPELALARRFFESEIDLSPPNGRFVGLHTGGNTLTIPGNHDHWAGVALPIGATPSNYYHYFIRSLPAFRTIPLGRKGHVLTLIEIDSDADVPPNSIQRAFARGSFRSQLLKLDQALAPQEDFEVRVLVIHHALTWTNFGLAMTASTKAELDRFLPQHGIRVILCGHTHSASMRRHYAGSRECWECGAGSTTQFDTVPLKWRRRLRKQHMAILKPNSLILHRIFDVEGRLEWSATTYVRTATGFLPTYPPRQFALL